MIREDFLHQNAFHEVDTFASLNKQYKMLKLIHLFHELGNQAVDNYADFEDILAVPAKEKIGRAKYVPEGELATLDDIGAELTAQLKALSDGGESND